MVTLDPNDAAAVARDTQSAFRQLDDALRSTATLTISFLNAVADAGVTAKESQRILSVFHKSQGDIVAARGGMTAATAMLTGIQRRSNIAETGFGCPGPNNPLDYAQETPPLRIVA
ncbi:hypothetical protein [Sphingomonas pseudosanguinis]|uniref:Na+/H+ antiporter NhaA n=1 Tax=Sphingomonas pseudosanguinis TaxID=413712 RepID=A0A7W6A781_9SPHN|nr:hypothetical protein [Sphingomonas pseudosanguinis]MBB3878477.1 Na+/H+ antiporter NhaA [Sphingomonas pseudosanguinis]MBN3536268.1 hypothetical protein [Sphingomonas pseudosanguinis]